jgi:hypothetical protein
MELFDLLGRGGPQRVWRRGNKESGLELWRDPEKKLFYKLWRTYIFKCPRCLERNYRTLNWTVPYVAGVDPVQSASKENIKVSCTRCNDPITTNVDLGSSEYFGG